MLGLVCTAAAFVIFTVLIREAGTSRATVITYINPVIAVMLGVTLLGERPGAGAVAGLLLILAGSWLSTDGRLPPGLSAWAGRRRTARVARGPSAGGSGYARLKRSGIEKRAHRAGIRVAEPERQHLGVTMSDSSTEGIKTVLHPVSDLEAAKACLQLPARRGTAERFVPTTSASRRRASRSDWFRAVGPRP